MKSIKILLLFGCLFSIIYPRDECEYSSPTKKEDCTDYKLTTLEKGYSDSCCYVEYKQTASSTATYECESFRKKGVTKDFITAYIKEYEVNSLSIDCGCNWLSLSLIFTFLVFLF